MRKFLLFFSLLLMTLELSAQKVVSGMVTDGKGTALIGANIQVKGTSIGTVSDFNGNYNITVPAGSDVLVISYTGYATHEMTVTNAGNMNVLLEEGVVLGETVVTALGITRKEKSLGYSVQQVNSDALVENHATSVLEALEGQVAGLQATKSNGNAGAPTRVVMRGPSTFNGNNEAIIVVDGVRVNNAENHSERSLGGVSNSNRAIDINPNDVESVTVLKGGAASALYGAEGANGVLVITTKKGKNTQGKVNVDFNTSLSFSEANKFPELQNKYVQGTGGNYRSPATGQSGSWGPAADTLYWDGASGNPFDANGNIVGQSDPNAQKKFVPYDNYNLFKTGMTYNNYLGFSGGTDIVNFKISAGNTTEDGITPLNTFKRTTVAASLGTNLMHNKMHLTGNANYINSGGRRIQQGSNISGLMLGLLRTPISFDNSYGHGSDAVDFRDAIYQPNGKQRNYRGGGGYDNPFWSIVNNPFRDNVNRLLGSFQGSYDFSQWFTLGLNVGLDSYSDNRTQSFELGSRNFPTGRIFDDTYIFNDQDWYLTASGRGSLSDKFGLDYTLGTNLNRQNIVNDYIQGDGFSFPGFPNLANAGSISTVKTLTNSKSASVFGSASLSFNDILFLNVTGRQDWLSSLIDPSRALNLSDIAVFYPSVSLGYIFSENVHANFLDYGKLRVSYAEVGAGAPAAYLTSTTFVVPPTAGTVNDLNDGWTNGIAFPFNGSVTGFEKDNVLGATKLKPSTTKEIELGLDLKMFSKRVDLDLSVYKKNSVDQIVTVPIAASTGFQRATINSGELETKGIDVNLTLTPVRTIDFNWDLGFAFTKWKTNVLSIADGVNQIYLDGFQGSSIYNLGPTTDANGKKTIYEYGQLYGGAWLRDGQGNIVIGDDPTSDYYGYPLADPLQEHIGNPNPDFLLGINNHLRFKNLSLSFLFDIKSGGQMWNGTKGALTFFGRSANTLNRGSEKVFTGVNGHFDVDGNLVLAGKTNDISAVLDQGWYQDNGGGFGVVSEDFIEDASFVRLRNVALSYDFTKMMKNHKVLQGATLTLSGYNLWLHTKYTGVDPETSLVGSNSNGQGLDYFQGPNTKSYTVTIGLKF
ncbi:MAG: SusC/RagA family TonB-linked outer membrane protein [Saprospiraceae bacterium]